MIPPVQSVMDGVPSSATDKGVVGGAVLSWHGGENVDFMRILADVEGGLQQIVAGRVLPGDRCLVGQVFRAMSGLYRRAAQRGMREVCDLAYEVAQAFGTVRCVDCESTRRLARLAQVAVGQMRQLLTPGPEEARIRHAKQTVADLFSL
ncbi:MAG: hypothetical protein H7837_08975 [Magnetococcus sp. MYC-9]